MPPTQTRAQREADQVAGWLDEILTLVGGPAALKLPTYTNWRKRVVSVVRRDGEPDVVDGYKTKHGATDGGGNAELTAVESAVFRLVSGRRDGDVVHTSSKLIVSRVRQMRDFLVSVDNAVRVVPAEPGAPTEDARLCTCCRELPGDRETDVNGALPGVRFLCLECITFVERQAGSRIGKPRLPNPVELEARRQGKRPKAHVNPKAGPFSWRDGSSTGITPTPPTAA